MKQTIDNFSASAQGYAAFRPQSPAEVYDFLYQHVGNYNAAWDCGTGNGQVATQLSERFSTVFGTDISAEQLQRAQQRPNIIYLQERAEATTLKDKSIDLITIAQAIHWFDFDAFYNEVKRVAAAGALVAAWTYTTLQLPQPVNEVIQHFYNHITRPYWDAERKWVDECYATIPFPFREVKAPPIEMTTQWNIQQLVGYLRTWSGVQNYIRKEGTDPLLLITEDLQHAWGAEDTLPVRFPIHVRAGFVD